MTEQPTRRNGWYTTFLPMGAFIPVLVLLSFAYKGIDFGFYWDEDYNKINGIEYSLERDFTLLPDSYTYPGVNYWLTFAAMYPELRELISKKVWTAEAFRARLKPLIRSLEFRLRLRRIYAFVVALTAAWIYLTVFVWCRSWIAGLIASLAFACSWEVVYHSRWIAPDGVMMQFGALSFLFASIAWKQNRRWPLHVAAAAAGLTCGSKYPGALILLPVLAVVWLLPIGAWRAVFQALGRSCGICLIFFSSYVVTTPGTLLAPLSFYGSLTTSINIYATGWFGYGVRPGFDHFRGIMNYLSVHFFSTWVPVAIGFTILAVCGLVNLSRQSWRDTFLVLLFPCVYLVYFSSQALMVVRNYFVLVPFFALSIGLGAAWVMDRERKPLARHAFLLAVASAILWNANVQWVDAESIAHRGDTGRFVAEFEKYASSHPDRKMVISPKVEAELEKVRFLPQSNLIAQRDIDPLLPVWEYVSYYSESVLPSAYDWKTNVPNTFAAVFGPREINLDYYTGWLGDDRIVSIDGALAREKGLLPLRGFHWSGEVEFGAFAKGDRSPMLVTGATSVADFIYFIRVGAGVVQPLWNHWGVGDSEGVPLTTSAGQVHHVEVEIDVEAGAMDMTIDGNPSLSYRGPVFPFPLSQIHVGENNLGTQYIARKFDGVVRETRRSAK